MTLTLSLLFWIIAFVLFVIAGLGWEPPRGSLLAIGAAFLTLGFIFSGVR